MTSLIVKNNFDPLGHLSEFQKKSSFEEGKIGASAMFVGTMRDFNDGYEIESLFLEHYEGMAERVLEDIRSKAIKRWSLDEALIVHRVGLIYPGEAIVLVATWSSHRAHAFESCRSMMETLKSEAPFWKKEYSARGVRWVSKNTRGATNL